MRVGPTLRGLVVIVLIAGIVTALRLENTIAALFLVARLAFFLAIAYFLFLVWRERRHEISTWSARAQAVFYGAVLLALADIGAAFAIDYPSNGLEALVFFAVLAACGFAIWRVWRDEHTYA